MSAGRDNAADVECSSENKVEGEDSWRRTVNCLRGRLLAERMASRNATEEADHLEIRLLEVEKLLEQEGKSIKRAEKKLKLLRKKLQSINISSYIADESQHFSSASSSSSAAAASCGDDDSISMSMSMALVPVEVEKERAVDPEILDATVRKVLESLRHAKEQLQSSTERRRRLSLSTSTNTNTSTSIIRVG